MQEYIFQKYLDMPTKEKLQAYYQKGSDIIPRCIKILDYIGYDSSQKLSDAFCFMPQEMSEAI